MWRQHNCAPPGSRQLAGFRNTKNSFVGFVGFVRKESDV